MIVTAGGLPVSPHDVPWQCGPPAPTPGDVVASGVSLAQRHLGEETDVRAAHGRLPLARAGRAQPGVLTKVVADVLGHSSATITADLYSHTTEPTTRDASARVASAMFGRSR